jgi:hypothetical protein
MGNKQFDSDFNEVKHAVKKSLPFIILIIIGISIFGAVSGWFSEASNVAREEFGPRAMLKKYEYFKDASQQLSAKENDIIIYEEKVKSFCSNIASLDRISRENCSLWMQESAGLKMSFNSLAAEYNSQSNKFNWESFDKTDGDSVPKSFKRR